MPAGDHGGGGVSPRNLTIDGPKAGASLLPKGQRSDTTIISIGITTCWRLRALTRLQSDKSLSTKLYILLEKQKLYNII
jgi:hypothetical protein